MKPFFRYFGSKWQMARFYGPPRRPIVIEPFAGGAGYSTYWNAEKVILVEKDERTAAIWHWLIHDCSYDDMMALDPTLTDLAGCPYPQHIKDFIGFWFARGSHSGSATSMPPANIKSDAKVPGRFWGSQVKQRLANQLHRIKSWQIIHGDYRDAPDIEAHWHIDPPYIIEGKWYRHGNKQLDYAELADWCRARQGTGEVCEAGNADWLNFQHLRNMRSQAGSHRYNEVVYRLDRPFQGNELWKSETVWKRKHT